MFELRKRDVVLAYKDISTGMNNWRIWNHLALQEVRQRYRRSTFGPLWFTATVGVQIWVMGWLMGLLLGIDMHKVVPYIATGFVIWTFWMTLIMEGSTCFISAAGVIVQVNRPLTVYLMQTVWRNIIILGHHAVIFIVVFIIYSIVPNGNLFLLLLTFPLLMINIGWMVLILGVVSVRFRDVSAILQNLMTVLFWMTPIFYKPEQLGSRRFIADINPLAHLIDIVRKPLLGEAPSALNWEVSIGMAIVGWIIAFLFFARFRSRVPYWL